MAKRKRSVSGNVSSEPNTRKSLKRGRTFSGGAIVELREIIISTVNAELESAEGGAEAFRYFLKTWGRRRHRTTPLIAEIIFQGIRRKIAGGPLFLNRIKIDETLFALSMPATHYIYRICVKAES